MTCAKIENRLKNIIVENSSLKCSNSSWNTAKNSTDLWTVRKNIIANESDKTYKYIEVTEWELDEEKCIIIGFNPAIDDVEKVDETNKKIFNVIKNSYGGCILLNLFPQVSPTKEKWDEADEEDATFKPVFIRLLSEIIKSTEKVIIFWGRTVGVDEEIRDKLIELQAKGRLFKTVKEKTDKHYHPSRVNIEIRKMEKESIITTISIL